MNISAILSGVKAVAGHPIAKGGGLASLISGGLYAAILAGVAIPEWSLFVGPAIGYVVYKFSPPKVQQAIDDATNKVIELATEIPQTYYAPGDFPNAPPTTTATNNIIKD